MDLSFQEKSILGSLVITIGLFSYYFTAVFEVLASGSATALQEFPLVLVGVVIAVVSFSMQLYYYRRGF